jgi:hypothetical protein
MKIRPVGAELFHSCERTIMTKLAVAFRFIAKVPKKQLHRLIPTRSRDFSPKRADRLCGSPNLLFNEYCVSLRRGGGGEAEEEGM